MHNSKSSSSRAKRKQSASNPLDPNEKVSTPFEEEINVWKQEVSSLSYEDALNALDLLLESLQNDSVPLEELREFHLKGSIYLDHCQTLLDNAEQTVIQLDPHSLEE